MNSNWLKTVADEFQKWYGIAMTELQIEAILDTDPEFKQSITGICSLDTCDRGILGDLFVKSLGIRLDHWPINAERVSWSDWVDIYIKSVEKGYGVDWSDAFSVYNQPKPKTL